MFGMVDGWLKSANVRSSLLDAQLYARSFGKFAVRQLNHSIPYYALEFLCCATGRAERSRGRE